MKHSITMSMATSSTSTVLPLSSFYPRNQQILQKHHLNLNFNLKKKRVSFFCVQAAAKPPAGVEFPKVQPQFKAPFLGFTKTAETWNSRACMIGLIGVFILESIINKGILQLIGVDIGKGLNLPL